MPRLRARTPMRFVPCVRIGGRDMGMISRISDARITSPKTGSTSPPSSLFAETERRRNADIQNAHGSSKGNEIS